MAKAQLKILLFLISVGIASGCVAVAYWVWVNVLERETQVQKEITKVQSQVLAPPDPGAKRFDAGVELIRAGKIEEGREALYKLVEQYPESPTCVEAKRIIGEINMDRLFSPNQLAGKKDYIVQPGDSLALIARNHKTNLDMLVRINGLSGTTLQPGDHLLVVPLEFEYRVDVAAKTVILLRGSVFFKQYSALDVKLPPGVRVPVELEMDVKRALAEGKQITSEDPRYIESEKWIPTSKGGIAFRSVPVAKPVTDNPRPVSKGKEGGSADVSLEPPVETGVFMTRDDLEELFALTRKGAKVTFYRSGLAPATRS